MRSVTSVKEAEENEPSVDCLRHFVIVAKLLYLMCQ